MSSKKIFRTLLAIGSIVTFIFLARLEADSSTTGQPSPCNVNGSLDVVNSSSRLYYLLTNGMGVQVWYVDQIGHHNTGLSVNYPSNTPFTKTRISPSGNKIAILFYNSEGDPPVFSAPATVKVIDLVNNSSAGYPVTLEEEGYGTVGPWNPTSVSGTSWLASNLMWGWLDETRLVFNQFTARQLLDTTTGLQSSIAWPSNPWNNIQDSRQIPGFNNSPYAIYTRRSTAYEGFYDIAAVEVATGLATNSLVAKPGSVSFDLSGTRITAEDPHGNIIITNIVSGQQVTIPKDTSPIYADAVYLVPSSGNELVALHTYTLEKISDDHVYMIRPATATLLCSGQVNYGISLPSWSADNHYQFGMYSGNSVEIYVYNASTNELSVAISTNQINNYHEQGWNIKVVGWGANQNTPPTPTPGIVCDFNPNTATELVTAIQDANGTPEPSATNCLS